MTTTTVRGASGPAPAALLAAGAVRRRAEVLAVRHRRTRERLALLHRLQRS